jgi:hypothetical protein
MIYLVILLLVVIFLSSQSYTWKSDQISILLDGVHSYASIGYKMSVNILANGELYQPSNQEGHYKLNFTLYSITSDSWFHGATPCIPQDAKESEVMRIIASTMMYDQLMTSHSFSYFMSMKVKKYSNTNSSYWRSSYAYTIESTNIGYFNASLLTSSCAKAKTVAYWKDNSHWYERKAPTLSDDVVIPADAGVIILENGIKMNSLTMYGGTIIARQSSCPAGYSSLSGIANIGKCYMLNKQPLSFDDAGKYCKEVGGGFVGSNLIEIANQEELELVKRLCRGEDNSSLVRRSGCWIGLEYSSQSNVSKWLEPNAVDNNGYRSWHRSFVSSISNSSFSKCGYIHPWQLDPMTTEEGSFLLDDCYRAHPSICQTFGKTVMHDVIIDNAHLDDSIIIGGNLVLNGNSSINAVTLSQGASIRILGNSSIQSLVMNDGSSCAIMGNVSLLASSHIGEALDIVSTGIQSKLYIGRDVAISTSAAKNSNVTINAQVDFQGQILIDDHVNLLVSQGGDLSQARVNTTSAFSMIELSNDAMKLESFDSFELRLSHRGPVSEEINDPSAKGLQQRGVYRLRVSSANIISSQTTSCIPYNATADQLTTILSNLSIIQSHGGVTVRRYGSGVDPIYSYGYTYRIDIDCVSSSHFLTSDIVTIGIACYGSDHGCGCRETKVPLVDSIHQSSTSSIQNCPKGAASSILDSKSCVFAPSIEIRRVTTMSRAQLTGPGSLILRQGIHRLPSSIDMNIIITNQAIGIVASDLITWTSLSLNSRAKLLITGPCWQSWDLVNDFYLSSNTNLAARKYINRIDDIPPFEMIVQRVRIEGLASVYTGSKSSNLTWTNLFWSGGTIGGMSEIRINSRAIITNSFDKVLRYGMVLMITENARIDWLSGDLTMLEASQLLIDGIFISSTSEAIIGNTELAKSSHQPELLQDALGRYLNPVCGGLSCITLPSITFRKHSVFESASQSNITFLLPLNLLDQSQIKLNFSSSTIIGQGGICGDDAAINMETDAKLILTDGEFNMDRKCSIRGEGEMIVYGGRHDIAYIIDATIKIQSGMMIWPSSRGDRGVITFNGGLHLENHGVLQIQPFSTTMLINKEVLLKDNSTIRFPDIGIATQPSPSDRRDAPDNSPRGNFTVKGIMKFYGGTLSGKVDINVLKELDLDGDVKNIKSLAKLVNYGHASWGAGDIILENNADFLNLGEIQIKDGINPDEFRAGTLMRGVILPLENGGDAYAQNYHSYDVDQVRISILAS